MTVKRITKKTPIHPRPSGTPMPKPAIITVLDEFEKELAIIGKSDATAYETVKAIHHDVVPNFVRDHPHQPRATALLSDLLNENTRNHYEKVGPVLCLALDRLGQMIEAEILIQKANK